MISPKVLQIGWLVFRVIRKLYPIGREVFESYQGKSLGRRMKNAPIRDIKNKANAEGFEIGNTEAELIRSAIHYVVDKKFRRKGLKKRKRS
jgi:hypothetical protein